MNSGLFISGTDTGVGKTYVTSIILRELRAAGIEVAAFKPACSGADIGPDGQPSWGDLERLGLASGLTDLNRLCPYRLIEPLAPPVAARRAGICLDEQRIEAAFEDVRAASEFVVVEGVGGLLCPLTEQWNVADFVRRTQLPMIVVARLGLGTLNHTLLTLEAAAARDISVIGIVMNDTDQSARTVAGQTNIEELQRRTEIPVLGYVPFGADSVCLWPQNTPARIAWNELP